MDGESCGTCRFWRPPTDDDRYRNYREGYCRRYPPQGRDEVPRTLPGTWCGEFEQAMERRAQDA